MPGWDYNGDHHWGYGWLGALLMIITMIVFWGGLITVAVLLLRRLGRRDPRQDSARHILDERFARGEIEQDEYEARCRTLRQDVERGAS
jgi:putative membrane protein